jgi:hypothetical protein
MIAAATITPAQLKRLQVLYRDWERHSLDCPGPSREARMGWASQATGRAISSFNDLTKIEAKRLIDSLQGVLGVKAPNKSPRRRQTRKDGEKMGTEGRHDQIHAETTLVGPHELEMVQRDLSRLGWTEARLEAFLRSPCSPLKGSHSIRTLGDANKIHWALKRLKPDQERKAS